MALSWQVEDAMRRPRKVIGGKGIAVSLWIPDTPQEAARADADTVSAARALAGVASDAGHLAELLDALMWRRRGVCGMCGGDVPVRGDGLLIEHQDRVLTRAGYDPLPCPGSRTGSEASDG